MLLYVDENLASHQLAALLVAQGHTIATTLRGPDDPTVWAHAQAIAAVVITQNAKDFAPLAHATPSHHGLLVVKRNTMRASDIAAAVAAVVAQHGGVQTLTLILNHYRPAAPGVAGPTTPRAGSTPTKP